MKYWLCEFHEQNGEAEYKHRHIYNDKQLDDIGHEGDDYDYRILNHFFMENITKDDEDGGGYWTGDGCRIVRFDGMTEVKKKDFKIMSMCGVYYVGDSIRLTWNKTTESYDEYYEEKYRMKGASTKV
jgi:hypothetical protein